MTVSGPELGRASLLRRLAEAGSRLVRTFDLREPSWVRPLPRVGIQIGRWVPAWAVLVCAAAVAVASIAMVATSRPQWVLASVLVGLMLLRPSGAPPALFALWLGLQVATSDIASFTLVASGLVLGLHLVTVLLVVAADLPLRTRIELRVFAGPLRRLLVIQALVQPVAWATMALAASEITMRGLPILAAVGVVAVSWTLARRITRPN